jgi:hypothetical protein
VGYRYDEGDLKPSAITAEPTWAEFPAHRGPVQTIEDPAAVWNTGGRQQSTRLRAPSSLEKHGTNLAKNNGQSGLLKVLLYSECLTMIPLLL